MNRLRPLPPLLAGLAAALALVLALALGGCAQAPGYPRAPSAQPNVTVLPHKLFIPGLQRERTLRLYLPPSYASQPQRRYPVIYMHDGQNLFDDATAFAGEWGVDETLNEMARDKGFEAIVVGMDNGGARRMTELNPWDNPRLGSGEGTAYVEFIVNVVKPYIDTHYRTFPGRQDTAIIGSSMGGLISDYAIHHYPEVFAKAGVFSPAYWTADPQVFQHAHARPLPPDARVYLYIGGEEGAEMVGNVQRMAKLLAADGAPPAQGVTLHIEPAAHHNEAAWRAEFGRAVAWLFKLP